MLNTLLKANYDIYACTGEVIMEVRDCKECTPLTLKVFIDMIKQRHKKPLYTLNGIAFKYENNIPNLDTKYNFELAYEKDNPIRNNKLYLEQDKIGYIYLSEVDGKRSVIYDRPDVNVKFAHIKLDK